MRVPKLPFTSIGKELNKIKIRLAGVEPESTVDGPGVRYTIFV